jgi:hypothetical protein
MAENEARRVWADCLECPPLNLRDFGLHQETYERAGRFFWWLHRMLPITNVTVAASVPIHPQSRAFLAETMGGQCMIVADLPGKVDTASKRLGADFDPEAILLESLAAQQIIRRQDLSRLEGMRQLITDPIPKWLLLQKMVTEEQLHRVSLDMAKLPLAGAWTVEEARRLWPLLAPGFASQNGCYCLSESAGNIRIGLSQLPSGRILRELHDRLHGYALWFEAVKFEDYLRLKELGIELSGAG